MGTVSRSTADINNVLNLANGYVAAPFNSATNYAAGDYCSRSGKVYRCKTAGAAAWSASRWTEVVIGDELSTRGVYNSIVSGASAQVSSTADNFTQVQKLDLEAGTWLIMAGMSFSNNQTGFRQIGLTSADSISVDRLSPLHSAATGAGAGVVLNLTRAFYLASAGSVYLWARQNSGNTLTVYPYIQAIRLR